MPSLDWGESGKTVATDAGPHSTTPRGDSSHVREAPLEGPSRYMVVYVHVELWVLSLLVEEGRSTFGFRVGISAKFQGITKGKWSCHQSLGFSKV